MHSTKMAFMKITVSVTEQTLTLLGGEGNQCYPVSTALAGVGQIEGSHQTPLGRHTIRAKVGGDCPANAVFVGRRWTGEIYTPALDQAQPGRDWILSRILWLSGAELGKNRAGKCDTLRRFIYIHGTAYESEIGQPVSHGCIRMRNADMIELYDQVSLGTAVDIQLGRSHDRSSTTSLQANP
jgi:L,D-transpeptidase YbiS